MMRILAGVRMMRVNLAGTAAGVRGGEGRGRSERHRETARG